MTDYDHESWSSGKGRLVLNQGECAAQRGVPDEMNGPPDIPFTGERIVPGKVTEALFREHEARYAFAGQFVAGKDVLDVACGTGIGTEYLRKAGARSCTGIDIDAGAVNYARVAYPDCAFVQSDASNLRLHDQSVDLVVSFETIEHLQDQQKFLQECWRVLRPGGLFVCSTPNRAISRWWEFNPFHVRELSLREFRQIVEKSFGNSKMYAQNVKSLPLYVGRVVLLRMLERLRLKDVAKRLVRYKPPPLAARHEFSEGVSEDEIVVYKLGALGRPSFAIALAVKGRQ
jgi:ubiquinone/menaquinone biosynthesis C-methylase UbiE